MQNKFSIFAIGIFISFLRMSDVWTTTVSWEIPSNFSRITEQNWIIELFRLEKTFKIIESNHKPNTAKSTKQVQSKFFVRPFSLYQCLSFLCSFTERSQSDTTSNKFRMRWSKNEGRFTFVVCHSSLYLSAWKRRLVSCNRSLGTLTQINYKNICSATLLWRKNHVFKILFEMWLCREIG